MKERRREYVFRSFVGIREYLPLAAAALNGLFVGHEVPQLTSLHVIRQLLIGVHLPIFVYEKKRRNDEVEKANVR